MSRLGAEEADRHSARPGHSEHQLRTTVDFATAALAGSPWDSSVFAATPQGRVARRERPPSWHYRYVGPTLAAKIHDAGLALEFAG